MYHFMSSGPHFSTKMHHVTAPYTFSQNHLTDALVCVQFFILGHTDSCSTYWRLFYLWSRNELFQIKKFAVIFWFYLVIWVFKFKLNILFFFGTYNFLNYPFFGVSCNMWLQLLSTLSPSGSSSNRPLLGVRNSVLSFWPQRIYPEGQKGSGFGECPQSPFIHCKLGKLCVIPEHLPVWLLLLFTSGACHLLPAVFLKLVQTHWALEED